MENKVLIITIKLWQQTEKSSLEVRPILWGCFFFTNLQFPIQVYFFSKFSYPVFLASLFQFQPKKRVFSSCDLQLWSTTLTHKTWPISRSKEVISLETYRANIHSRSTTAKWSVKWLPQINEIIWHECFYEKNVLSDVEYSCYNV